MQLLAETARVTGLDGRLSAALAVAQAAGDHDLGKIVLDLAVALAAGGDCPADTSVLRAGSALFGPVPRPRRAAGSLTIWPGSWTPRWRRHWTGRSTSGPRGMGH